MWCEILKIGGITARRCERWAHDETTTCGICGGTARVPYPDPVPVCGCGMPGNHPTMCPYRRSFFENERQATPEEMAYARGIASGIAKTKAAAAVGKTPAQLDTVATRKFLAHVLDENDVTDEVVAQKIREGLNARMDIKLRDESGAESLVSVPDNTNQFRFTELAVKIKGGMAEKGQFALGDGNIVVINNYSRNPAEPENIIDVTDAEGR